MKACELIRDESNWTDTSFALDKNGKSVPWNDSSAVRFDLMGALHNTYNGFDLGGAYGAMYSSKEMIDGKSLPYYNRQWGWKVTYEFLKKYNI